MKPEQLICEFTTQISATTEKQWRPWFAWHPIRTLGGKLVWMKKVERYWNPMTNLQSVHPEDRGEYAGSWEYRMPSISHKALQNKPLEHSAGA